MWLESFNSQDDIFKQDLIKQEAVMKNFPHPVCYQWMLGFPFIFCMIPPTIASESIIKFLIAN